MPFDSTPRMTPLASVIFLPGIYVPTGEKTPFIPVRAFGAPQTTCTGPWPASTMQTLSRSAFGCGLASMTEATTKPSYLRLGSSTLSTSRPMRVSASTISASEAEVSRWSRSQERVNFIADQFDCAVWPRGRPGERSSSALSVRLGRARRLRPAQNTCDANVLVNFRPMDPKRRQFDHGSPIRRSGQKTRIPPKRCSEDAPVGERDDQVMIIALHRDWPRVLNFDLQNSHSRPPEGLGVAHGSCGRSCLDLARRSPG